jgi:predicted membrane-bound spermidine synthase
MSTIYNEDTSEEFGVVHSWRDCNILDSVITKCGTKIEIIDRPLWGLACYMDNSIQSCLVDEYLYHEALVHPVMSSVKSRKRVMIVGGGEGATAREVLKWNDVECVDMYDWDEEVVNLFKTKFGQWAKGAWNNPRLHLHFVNIFTEILKHPLPENRYDVIIIDLFDPTNQNRHMWKILLNNLDNWLNDNGSIVMYSGMRNILKKQQPYKILLDEIECKEMWRGIPIEEYNKSRVIMPYKIEIPSFSGEATFILIRNNTQLKYITFEEAKKIGCHLTQDIWNSYRTFNW